MPRKFNVAFRKWAAIPGLWLFALVPLLVVQKDVLAIVNVNAVNGSTSESF